MLVDVVETVLGGVVTLFMRPRSHSGSHLKMLLGGRSVTGMGGETSDSCGDVPKVEIKTCPTVESLPL